MKFPYDNCVGCGVDLTGADPGETERLTDEQVIGHCPSCGLVCLMADVEPEPAPEPESRARGRRGRREEPIAEPEAEAETVVESEPESTPEPDPE